MRFLTTRHGKIMRNHRAIINQELLLASSSQDVVRFFEKRASNPEEIELGDDDEELELALVDRNDPLITLALARYASYPATLKRIFASASNNDAHGNALRLAVLSNETLGNRRYSSLPEALFQHDWCVNKSELTSYLSSAEPEEISVLFQNKTLSTSFLRCFLEGGESWKYMSDRGRAVWALKFNRLVSEPFSRNECDDVFDVFKTLGAVWKLSERLPVAHPWPALLSDLFDKIFLTDMISLNEPLEVAQRWRPEASDQKEIEREAEENARGWLSVYQRVRKGLARLALKRTPRLLAELMASDDPAFRCAAYQSASLTCEQILAAYERDGELFFNAALENANLWRESKTRYALHNVLRSVANASKLDGIEYDMYRRIERQMEKEHPDWFEVEDEEDEQPEVDPGDMSATKSDLNQVAETIVFNTATATEPLAQQIRVMRTRMEWMLWFLLGAGGVWLWQRF